MTTTDILICFAPFIPFVLVMLAGTAIVAISDMKAAKRQAPRPEIELTPIDYRWHDANFDRLF